MKRAFYLTVLNQSFDWQMSEDSLLQLNQQRWNELALHVATDNAIDEVEFQASEITPVLVKLKNKIVSILILVYNPSHNVKKFGN